MEKFDSTRCPDSRQIVNGKERPHTLAFRLAHDPDGHTRQLDDGVVRARTLVGAVGNQPFWLIELEAGAASGLQAGLNLLALTATMMVGSRSARWGRSAMTVAICALPLVVILPAVLLFGVGGYLSSKGYVQCPDQLGGQRVPVIRKVLPEARALCADDVRSE